MRRPGELVDRAYREIRKAIANHTMRPGQMLQERTLADWLGFSRTPVREALRRLQAEGLIEATSRGFVVAELSVEDVNDSYMVIEVMEGLASRLAAERIDDQGREAIRLVLDSMEEAANSGNVQAWIHADSDLHQEIGRIAANPRVDRVLQSVYPIVERIRDTYLREGAEPDRLRAATEGHRLLGVAIMDGDPDLAEQLARQLFYRAREDNVRLLRHWVAPIRQNF